MDFTLQKRRNHIQYIIICLLLIVVSYSRSFAHRFTIHDFKRQKGWLYLGKHTFQPPKTQVFLSVLIRNNQIKADAFLDLQVLAVPSQFWAEQVEHQCDVKRYDREIHELQSQKELSFKMMISNQSRVFQTTKQIQSSQATTYYFVLKDCLSSFEKQNPSPYSQLKINLQVKSNHHNFVSNEQHNKWSLPLFILLSYLVLYFIKKDKNPPNNTWPLLLLKISIWTGIMSLIFKYIDHLYYAYSSGLHSNFLDALNIVCQSTSDSVVIFLLILLAFGWTVRFDNHQNFKTWMPPCLIFYFLLIVIMIMNKSRDTYHTKYHVLDTFAGYIMIALRIGLFGVFMFALRKSYQALTQKHTKVKNFLIQLTLFATIFLGYIPLCFILIQFFERQSRNQVMNIMLQTFQLLLTIWLSILIVWKASSYRQVVGTMVVAMKNEKYF